MRRNAANLLTGVACVLALGGCGRKTLAPEKEPLPVRVVAAEPQGEQARTRYSASIEPYEQVTLAFKASGYVREIRKVRGADGQRRKLQEGDSVRAGSVLARIHDTDYVARRNQAKASLAEAQAGLERARLDFGRAERLFQSQSVTKPDFDAARASLDAGQARVDSAQARLSESEVSLADTVITAPANGVILKRQIEAGTLVSAGSPGFVLAQTDSMKAVFGVPDWLVRQAQLGMTLPVRVESLGTEGFPGRITAISPIADPGTRLFEVELTVSNARGALKAGLIATVQVPEADPQAARERAAALVVPLAAIVRPAEGKFAVLVMEGEEARGTARLRAIEVGEVSGNMVAVRAGLKQGERVIVSGASLLTDGEAVQVIP
jgi:multidrug efflux system membrane fusion protein